MGKRLFVSIDLDGLEAEVERVQDYFSDAPGLNLTDPAQAHVTMKFLGDTPSHQVDAVVEGLVAAVEDAGVEPFTAKFEGLGVFPSLDYISVVWLGVEGGSEEMVTLQSAIESRLVELGFDEEDHEFTPHVTLARMEHAGGKELVQQTVTEENPTAGTMEIEEVRLTESVLTADGPEYKTLERIEL